MSSVSSRQRPLNRAARSAQFEYECLRPTDRRNPCSDGVPGLSQPAEVRVSDTNLTRELMTPPHAETPSSASLELPFLEPEETVQAPPVLYHYTDQHGLLGILTSGRIWATDVLHLNDSSEVRYALSEALEVFGSGEALINNRDATLKALGEYLRNSIETIRA